MTEKFKQIESVKGLRTVLAVEVKNNTLVYASSSINKGLATALLAQLMSLKQEYPQAVNQIIVNFKETRLLLYSLKDYLLVLHVDEHFSVQEMRNALQDSTPVTTVREKVDEQSAAVLAELEHRMVSSEDLLVYQQLISILKDYACEKMGAFVAANKLRDSKDKLHGAYKLLQSFIVGKDGSIAFRNTPEYSTAMASQAIAAWSLLFFRKCQEIIPEFGAGKIMELLRPLESQWKPLGFAEAWLEEKLVSELDS